MKIYKLPIIVISIFLIIILGIYISFKIMYNTEYKWLKERTMPFGTKIVDVKSAGYSSMFLDDKGNVYIIGQPDDLITFYGVKTHVMTLYSWYENKDFVRPIKVNENASEIIDIPNGLFSYKGIDNNLYSLNGELRADDSIKMLAIGYELTNKGKVIKVENNENNEIIDNIRFITTGEHNRVLAIDNNDVLYSWGNNKYGQLGDGTFVNKSEPTKILENVNFVRTHSIYTVAVTKNHDLFVWGRYGDKNSIINSTTPKKIASNVIDADVGNGYVIYYTTDNKVMYFGDRLYDGAKIRNNHYEVMTGDVKTLVANFNSFFVLLTDGTLFACGDGYNNYFWNTNDSFDIDNPIKIWDPKWDENIPKYEYYKNE